MFEGDFSSGRRNINCGPEPVKREFDHGPGARIGS